MPPAARRRSRRCSGTSIASPASGNRKRSGPDLTPSSRWPARRRNAHECRFHSVMPESAEL
jgi:hypothetical protein